jgi:hypothetical protein
LCWNINKLELCYPHKTKESRRKASALETKTNAKINMADDTFVIITVGYTSIPTAKVELVIIP